MEEQRQDFPGQANPQPEVTPEQRNAEEQSQQQQSAGATLSGVPENPAAGTEGIQPAPPVSEADNAATAPNVVDNPDKPDESSIAQVEVPPGGENAEGSESQGNS